MHNDDVDWTGQTDVSDVGDILTSREETIVKIIPFTIRDREVA